MMLGEVAPGGIGSGLYGMLVLAVVTVFVAGLMVGRTPEYLGKKIRAPRDEVRRALHPHHAGGRAHRHRRSRCASPSARASMLNAGPHGLSEVLYAFTSAANNNGSAFAGLTGQHRLLQHRARAGDAGRPVPADGVRARPGRLAGRAATRPGHRGHAAHPPAAVRRRCSSASSSIVVALTYFPALALGPARGRTRPMTTTTARAAGRRPGSAPGRRRAARPRMLLTQLPAACAQARPAHDGRATR